MKSNSSFFRNLRIYRLPSDWSMTAEGLNASLAASPLTSCGALATVSRGWLPAPRSDQFVHSVNGQWLIRLGAEEKHLPAAALQREVSKRAEKIETEQGRKVGRKEMRDLRERVTEELLPHVLPKPRTTSCWINPKGRWLVIDAGAVARADELLETLNRSIQGVALRPLQTTVSPSTAMTGWLAENDAPAGFSIDQDLELRAAAEGQSAIRYVRHALEGDEIRDHITAGKIATKLAMTWNDRISFLLTSKLEIKRLAFLDILTAQSEQEAESAEEQYDADFTLMAGELTRMLDDIVLALGGEPQPEPESRAAEPAPTAVIAEEAIA